MRVIIAGSRQFDNPAHIKLIDEAVERSGWREEITKVFSGTAKGIDRLGERWALDNHLPVQRFYPDWKRFGGKLAPLVRNELMAANADALICIWDARSRGTLHMIETARKKEVKLFIYYPYGHPFRFQSYHPTIFEVARMVVE